jgi:hypothetical protein
MALTRRVRRPHDRLLAARPRPGTVRRFENEDE